MNISVSSNSPRQIFFNPPASSSAAHPKPAINAVAKTFADRINCKWRESIMIAGIAIAIVGLIATLIVSSFFYAACFGILGAVSVFGYTYVHGYQQFAAVDEDVKAIKRTNVKLLAAQKTLEQSSTQLNDDYKKLSTEYDELDKELNSIREINKKLQQEKCKFQKSVEQLTIENTKMQQNETELQAKVAEFQHDVDKLDLQVVKFVSHQQEIGKGIANFEKDVEELGKDSAELDHSVDKLDQFVNAGVKKLAQQIETSKAASAKIFGTMQKQLSDLQKENEDMRKTHLALQADIGKLTEQAAGFQDLEKQRDAFIQKLQEENAHIKESTDKQTALDAHTIEDIASLRSQADLLAKESKEAQDNVRKAEAAIKNYTAHMAEIQQGQAKAEETLIKKIAEKEEVKHEIATLRDELAELQKKKAELAPAAS